MLSSSQPEMSLPVSIAMDASTPLTMRQAIARDYETLEIEWLTHPEMSSDARTFHGPISVRSPARRLPIRGSS